MCFSKNLFIFYSDWQFFRKITYPLGSKASIGRWRACATTDPWIERKKSEDGSVTNCAEFDVAEFSEPEPTFDVSWESRSGPSSSSIFDSGGLTSEPHFVTLKFGPEMKKSFRRDVPISGRVSYLNFVICYFSNSVSAFPSKLLV